MGWATHYIEKLRAGETVSFRPRGASMKGRIESGHLCTVAPVDCSTLSVGDIVLCKVHGAEYLHIVKAISGQRFQIGNNRGGIDGWIGANGILENAFVSSHKPELKPKSATRRVTSQLATIQALSYCLPLISTCAIQSEIAASEAMHNTRLNSDISILFRRKTRAILVMKNLFYAHSEKTGCPESQRQARIELAGLDGVDGLPGHIEGTGQLGLRPIALGA